MPHPVRPVILSGGSGTRLWPLSTPDKPKQFLKLLGRSLFEATLDRVSRLKGSGPALIVTGRDHLDSVQRSALAAGAEVGSLIVEPVGRNTGPAVIAAALVADEGDILLVLPADHVIGDQAGFEEGVRGAVDLARAGKIVLFGIVPDRPETGYGYIETSREIEGGFEVGAFLEKPDPDVAEDFVSGGRHLWNSGMFVFSARTILEECEAIRPDLLDAVRRAIPDDRETMVDLGPEFADAPAISIDHALIEHTRRAAVVPIDVGWSDVGSWQAVWEVSARDEAGNATAGDVLLSEVSRSYVRATSRRVAVLGLDDVVVVETPEAVLVVARDKSQLVREVAERSGDPD